MANQGLENRYPLYPSCAMHDQSGRRTDQVRGGCLIIALWHDRWRCGHARAPFQLFATLAQSVAEVLQTRRAGLVMITPWLGVPQDESAGKMGRPLETYD